jgi:hypothetical protein
MSGWLMIRLIGYHLHEHLLALWGVPIGEMLDLERLAQRCRELGRWTFFFTSAPANVHGQLRCYCIPAKMLTILS